MKMNLRTCTSCGTSKDQSEYYLYRKGGKSMAKCKLCCKTSTMVRYTERTDEVRAVQNDYYAANKERIQAYRKLQRQTDLRTKLAHMSRNSKQRANLKGWEYDLDIDFLMDLYEKQEGKCFYTGAELSLIGENRVSVDRTDPAKGYVKGNVTLVCLQVNYMKRDITHENFIKFCKLVGGRF